MTFFEFQRKFKTEEDVIDYFVKTRYGETVTCPHCGRQTRVYHRKDHPRLFVCLNCKNSFSVFTNTIFEKSDTDLRKWFYAIHLFLNGKKGISGKQLEREIGVTYKTAWRMLHLIREAMGNQDMSKAFEAIVEIDETYVRGKPRKENNDSGENHDDNDTPSAPTANKRGRGTKKTPVVGIKERNSKRVYAQVALPNKEGKKLSGKQLFKILDKVCKDDTVVMTDDFKGYNFLDHKNSNNYVRISVNHSMGQYSAGKGIHTNGIESFWAILKRSIMGIYHHVSIEYLQSYVDECCFRQNNKDNSESFNLLVKQCVFA